MSDTETIAELFQTLHSLPEPPQPPLPELLHRLPAPESLEQMAADYAARAELLHRAAAAIRSAASMIPPSWDDFIRSLSTRASKAIRALGAQDFTALTAHPPTDILALPNVGETTLCEIRDKLHARRLWLRDDDPSIE
jgi:hypothetical protein